MGRLEVGHDRPGQVRLTLNARAPELSAADASERWMSFLADCVGSRSVGYGQVVLDGNINHATSLDMALTRNPIDSIEESAKFLRGYGWITLCPAVRLISRTPERSPRFGH